jgi:hypothetical protein
MYSKKQILEELFIIWANHPYEGKFGSGYDKAIQDVANGLRSIPESNKEPLRMLVTTKEEILASELLAELRRAREKFPGKNVTFAALVEEVGELATATFEESSERVRKEAIQVAVMAMRMVLDGDHTFDQWRKEKGLDPLIKE